MDVDLLEYNENYSIQKNALSVISQKSLRRKASQILEKEELPGVSPVAEMIQGRNDTMKTRQFQKNYGYIKFLQHEKLPVIKKVQRL